MVVAAAAAAVAAVEAKVVVTVAAAAMAAAARAANVGGKRRRLRWRSRRRTLARAWHTQAVSTGTIVRVRQAFEWERAPFDATKSSRRYLPFAKNSHRPSHAARGPGTAAVHVGPAAHLLLAVPTQASLSERKCWPCRASSGTARATVDDAHDDGWNGGDEQRCEQDNEPQVGQW